MTFAGGWIVIFLTKTPSKLLQQPWTKTRTKQTKRTSGAATARIWGPTSSEVSCVKFPLPFRSQEEVESANHAVPVSDPMVDSYLRSKLYPQHPWMDVDSEDRR